MLVNNKTDAKAKHLDRVGKRPQDPLNLVLSQIEALIRGTPTSLIRSLDRNGIIRQWDATCERIYGYTARQAVGRRLEDLLLSPQAAAEIKQGLNRVSLGPATAPEQEKVKLKTTGKQLRRTGIELVGDTPWGTHFCQFYQTKEDLIDILAPYFKAGLEDNEYCMWVTSEPLTSQEAKRALEAKVKNFDEYIKKGQIEIIDYDQWYTKSGHFESDKVLQGWVDKEREALGRGFDGLRLSGNTFWLEESCWRDFTNYEETVNKVINKYRVLAICAYCLDKCTGSEIIDVVGNHQFALIKRDGKWDIIESSEYKRVVEELRTSRERYKNLLETVPHGIQQVDTSGRIIFANKALHKIYGYAEGELLTKEIFDLVPSDADRSKLRTYLEQLGKGQLLPIPYETKGLAKDGRVIDTQVNWSYVRNSLGRVTGFVSVITDVTDRKEIEKALLRERDNLIGILNAMQDGVYIADQQFNIQYVNPCLEKDFGSFDGQKRKCYEYFQGRHQPCTWCGMADVIAGRSVNREWYSTKSAKTYDLIATPVKNQDGAVLKLGILHDITEFKDVEERTLLEEQILECVNQQIRAPNLIRDVLKLVKAATGFETVGIHLHNGNDFLCFTLRGLSGDSFEMENSCCAGDDNGNPNCGWQDNQLLQCMQNKVLTGGMDSAPSFFTEGGSFWTDSTTRLLAAAPSEALEMWVKGGCPKVTCESIALVPLRSGEQIVGLLQLSDTWPGRINLEMVRFFEKVATALGVALARIKAEEQVENLAKFPSEDPFPVLRINQHGIILYSNLAGQSLLQQWNCRPGESVPEDWCKVIAEVLDCSTNKVTEVECGDRILSLVITPVSDGRYVNLYGRDVTEQRLAEQQILKFNKELERRVAERTARLARANKRLRAEIEQRKRLERDILDISERERRRVGRELHDSIGQQFTGIAFLVKVLERKLAGKFSEEAEKAAEIAELVNHATNQTRSLARGLHPVELRTNNLISALRELAASTQLLFNIRCDFKCDGAVPIDDTATAVHLYRIAQEAITNAVKHGRAESIQMELNCGSH